ncbi:MAG: diacylglycerol kinase family protein [Pirellulaceae bacterium]
MTHVETTTPSSLVSPDRSVQQVIAVASPKAGTGAGREQLPLLGQMLAENGIRFSQTSSIEALKQCLQDSPCTDSKPYHSVVVAAGGDGTLSLVASSVDARVSIVPMPLGTENLLARYFGYQATAQCMFDAIMTGNSYRMDAGQANGKLFLIMASCGFDAEVVRGVHLKRRGHINRFSYAKPIWRAIRRYAFPEIHVTVDGPASKHEQNGDGEKELQLAAPVGWAMVFNLPRYGGGLMIEPDAIGTDGKLDVITFGKGSVTSGLRYFGGIVTGSHTKFSDVVRRRGKTIQITSDTRVPYQLDGDYAGRLPLTIETLPRRLHLLLPAVGAQ